MPHYTYDNDPFGTLKNKLGVTDPAALEKLEARFVAGRLAEIEAGLGPTGKFDADHLKAIHRHLFQDVYEWAGHTRNKRVQLADGTAASEPIMSKADGTPFMPGTQIDRALEKIEAGLRQEHHLRELRPEQFAEKAADLLALINGVHAFREGNGRTQRVFVAELARQAGHELDFSVVSQERMVRASIAAREEADPAMMRRLFGEIINPARVEALQPAIVSLVAQGFPWNDCYLATTEPGRPVQLVMAGVAGDNFMARTAAEILIGKTEDLPSPPPRQGETFTCSPTPWPAPARQDRDDIDQTEAARQAHTGGQQPAAPAGTDRHQLFDPATATAEEKRAEVVRRMKMFEERRAQAAEQERQEREGQLHGRGRPAG